MKRKENLLTLLIVLGLVGGMLYGQFGIYDPTATAASLVEQTASLQLAGDLVFLRPLRMLIIPLVFCSVVVGVTSIGNPSKLGLVGGATVMYFVTTTLIAVLMGLAIVMAIKPGAGVSSPELLAAAQSTFETDVSSKIESGPADVGNAFLNLLTQMIPTNVLEAAAKGDVLPVVIFAILLGVALAMAGRAASVAVQTLEGILAALMKVVGWVIWLAPIGVFCIIAARVGQTGLSNLVGPMGKYIVCVLIGLGLQAVLVLPLFLFIFGRTNPYKFMWQMRKVLLTAFSTASSSATLPVTIEECRNSGGCSKRASTFVPALGSTINMNGTALYEAVAVIFLFQVFNIDLTLTQKLIILVTATLAAIGAPGIPSAGLVTMAIVINAVNSSLQYVSPDSPTLPLYTIGIIYGVDRFLDMFRTVLNVFGDSVGAKIITRLAPDEPEEQPGRADAMG